MMLWVNPDVVNVGRIKHVKQISTTGRLLNELPEAVAEQYVVQLFADASVDAGTVQVATDDQPGRVLNDCVQK